jgi:hypothetical protein
MTRGIDFLLNFRLPLRQFAQVGDQRRSPKADALSKSAARRVFVPLIVAPSHHRANSTAENADFGSFSLASPRMADYLLVSGGFDT